MRISIDVSSVQDASRVLTAAAEEYERTAASLQRGDGLGGVTGSQRYWLMTAVDSVASQIRAVAARHREVADELGRRSATASSSQSVSPVYAGLAVAAALGGGPASISFDRDGDGIDDTTAIDQDGDGVFETFAIDRQQDGIYDTVLVSDAAGNLLGAGFDVDQDGHMEGFVGVVAGGAVMASATDRLGGYELTALPAPSVAPPVNPPPPNPLGGSMTIGGNSIYDSIHVPASAIGYGNTVGGTSIYDSIHVPTSAIGYGNTVGGTWAYTPPSFMTFLDDTIGPPTNPGMNPFGNFYAGAWSTAFTNATPAGQALLAGAAYGSWNYDYIWDDSGVIQPELGSADTYDWYNDRRLDPDNDGIPNYWDDNVRVYDED